MTERTRGTPGAREYPRDEFDEITPGEGRRGAHRARPNPVLAMLPLLLVVVLVVAVVVGSITLLGEDAPEPPLPAATAPAAPPTQQPSDAPTAAPTLPATPGGTAPAPPATTSAPPVDTEVAITVLNGTRTSGLATGATRRLNAEGWNVVRADNYRDGDPPPTTVFYPREELAPTAEAVAEDLGGAATDLDEAFGDQGLTVVLGEDYQP
jgi:hypothetical protein